MWGEEGPACVPTRRNSPMCPQAYWDGGSVLTSRSRMALHGGPSCCASSLCLVGLAVASVRQRSRTGVLYSTTAAAQTTVRRPSSAAPRRRLSPRRGRVVTALKRPFAASEAALGACCDLPGRSHRAEARSAASAPAAEAPRARSLSVHVYGGTKFATRRADASALATTSGVCRAPRKEAS